jgi:tetratricopeptide (TPR) repeat protein
MTQSLHSWFFLGVLLLTPALNAEEPAVSSPGLETWRKGQEALLEGHNDKAITLFRESLEQDPKLARNHLSLAAAYLALGENEQAAGQLERYLRAQPDHYVVRGQYAELLLRMDRLDDAREAFERFAEDIEDNENLARQHLANCHGKLLDIASRIEDDYGMHLHRGIGLYWLAQQSRDVPDTGDELSTESLLCQAASELVLARRQRPGEARPSWYLHEVWSQLGQRQPAARWLRAAEEAAPFSYLTPTEQRRLHLACRQKAEEGARK